MFCCGCLIYRQPFTVDHSILMERLSRTFAIYDGVLDWIRDYLSGCRFTVRFGGSESLPRDMQYGVPHGSVLGPLLFVLYTANLGSISAQYGVRSHFYADVLQLYISARPHEAANAASQLVDCMESMAQWMASNQLNLNPAKTDFMRCATRRRQHQLSREALMFGGVTKQPPSTVCDLGVILNPELSLSPHINHLVSRCFHQLRCIKSSVRALQTEAAKTVVNSFVVSRVDYCNSLLAGVLQYQLDRLQAVMNTAARVVLGVGKFDRIRHLLSDRLHWLPVHKRVQFNCAY